MMARRLVMLVFCPLDHSDNSIKATCSTEAFPTSQSIKFHSRTRWFEVRFIIDLIACSILEVGEAMVQQHECSC